VILTQIPQINLGIEGQVRTPATSALLGAPARHSLTPMQNIYRQLSLTSQTLDVQVTQSINVNLFIYRRSKSKQLLNIHACHIASVTSHTHTRITANAAS